MLAIAALPPRSREQRLKEEASAKTSTNFASCENDETSFFALVSSASADSLSRPDPIRRSGSKKVWSPRICSVCPEPSGTQLGCYIVKSLPSEESSGMENLDQVIGFVDPGCGIVDTGASKAIIGKPSLRTLAKCLRRVGLNYVWVPKGLWHGSPCARGVGGSGEVIGIALVPMSIAKQSLML